MKTKIGAIHHLLRSRRNSKNSLMIASRFMGRFLKGQRNQVKAFLELALVSIGRLHLSPGLDPIARRPFVPFSGKEIFLE